jgi:hypothetical protein
MSPSQTLRIPPVNLFQLVVFASGLAMVFVAGTGLVFGILADPDHLTGVLSKPSVILVLSQFNLAAENTVATWFSSMVLFVTAVFALLCYGIGAGEVAKRRFSYGWILMALFFLVLSLDEIGSIHENAGQISSLDLFGNQTWESVLILPLILVTAYMMAFAWTQLKDRLPIFLLMAAGALLLVSIPVQEHIESGMWKLHEADEGWNRPLVFVLLEEGTEMAAAFFFIWSMYLYLTSTPASYPGVIKIGPLSDQRVIMFAGIAVVVMLVTFLLSLQLNSVPRSDEGVPVNWYPAIIAATLSIGRLFFWKDRHPVRILYPLMLSAYFGSNLYSLMGWSQIQSLAITMRVVMTVGLIFYIYVISYPVRDPLWRARHIAAGMLIGPGFVLTSVWVTIPVVAGLLVLVYSLSTSIFHFGSQKPALPDSFR